MKINWDSEVLSSVSKAVDQLEYLSINKDSIESVADWLAYEEFPFPINAAAKDDADDFIRATMFMNTLNFAFTDFDKCIKYEICLLYTSPSPRDRTRSRMPSSA